MQPSEMEEGCSEECMLAFVSLLVNLEIPGLLQLVAEIFKYPF